FHPPNVPVFQGSVTLSNVGTPSKGTITRSTGSFVTDGLAVGHVVTLSGVNTANNGDYTVEAVTATTLTLNRAFVGTLPTAPTIAIRRAALTDLDNAVLLTFGLSLDETASEPADKRFLRFGTADFG